MTLGSRSGWAASPENPDSASFVTDSASSALVNESGTGFCHATLQLRNATLSA